MTPALLLAAMLGAWSPCDNTADYEDEEKDLMIFVAGSDFVCRPILYDQAAKYVRVIGSPNGFAAVVYKSHADRVSATNELGRESVNYGDTMVIIDGRLRFKMAPFSGEDVPFDFDVITISDVIYALEVQYDTVGTMKNGDLILYPKDNFYEGRERPLDQAIIIDGPRHPDTIGYWLSRRSTGGGQPMCVISFANGECADRDRPPPTPIVEVVDTVWVMRKR